MLIRTLISVFYLILVGWLLFEVLQKEQTKPTTRKYVIDLPEEISLSNGIDLEGELRNDTIFIYFKH